MVYVALEGARSVRDRVAAYRIANPDVHGGLPFVIISEAVDFLDHESVSILIDTIRAAETECGEKVSLVCVDTFARAVAGGDENSAMDVGLAVAGADRIRTRPGLAWASSTTAERIRAKGHGQLGAAGAVDTELDRERERGALCRREQAERPRERSAFALELVPVDIDMDLEDKTAIRSCVVKHVREEAAPAPQARGFAVGHSGNSSQPFGHERRQTPNVSGR